MIHSPMSSTVCHVDDAEDNYFSDIPLSHNPFVNDADADDTNCVSLDKLWMLSSQILPRRIKEAKMLV